MVNSKKKGNAWENRLANWLRDNGVKAWKDGASGGGNREKGDIGNNMDMTIESKASKTVKLMEWWGQVKESADKHHNAPVLFIHKDGMGESEWLVVMHSDDWLDRIVKQENQVEPVDRSINRNKKYVIERTIYQLKQLLKELEQE